MAQAPVLNKLYNLVNQDPTLKDKLKFLAVGKDDNDIKMKMWKAFHKVPFPLIADPNGIFAKALNFANYPVTMVLDKSGKIVRLIRDLPAHKLITYILYEESENWLFPAV